MEIEDVVVLLAKADLVILGRPFLILRANTSKDTVHKCLHGY